jgi:LPXTG-motif cell wall-anchored protein
VAYKLNDPSKVDYGTVNGVKKDLSDNVWSDLNGVRPGVFGAVEGVNTLVVFDALGNSTTIAFTLEAQSEAPSVEIVSVMSEGADGVHYDDEVVTITGTATKGSYDLFGQATVTVTGDNGVSVTRSPRIASDGAWSVTLDPAKMKLGAGAYQVSVTVRDTARTPNVSEAATASFTVVAYEAPGIEITAPGHGAEFTAGETVGVSTLVTEGTHGTESVALTVTDAEGVETVHVLHGAASLARSVGTTYGAALEGLEPGTYGLKATVADTTGHEAGESSSESVTVTVKAADTGGGDEDGDAGGGDTGDDGGSGTDTDGTDTGGTDADGTDTGGSGSGTDSGSTDSGSTSGLADGGSIGDAAVVLPAKPSLQGSADTGSADTGSADTGSTGSSATPDASSGTSSGALATTGADTVGVLALMGGLLAAGLAALGFRRRKEEETEV